MLGTIQQANKSKSGKTLSIQIEGQWYTSKCWELEQSVGKRLIFEPSIQTFPDGGSCSWLNDYVWEDASNTPSGQAMDAAMAQHPNAPPSPPPMGQPAPQATGAPVTTAQPNKDAVIGAMALCKCCTPGTPEQAFSNFVFLYHKLNSWDSNIPF